MAQLITVLMIFLSIGLAIASVVLPIVGKGLRMSGLWLPLTIMVVLIFLDLKFDVPQWLDTLGIGIWIVSLAFPIFVMIRGIVRFIRGLITPMPEVQVIQDLEIDDELLLHNGKIYAPIEKYENR